MPRLDRTVKSAFSCGLCLLLVSCSHTVRVNSVPPGATVRETSRGHLGNTANRPVVLSNVSRGSRVELYVSKAGYEPKVITLNNIRENHNVLAILTAPSTTLWVGSVPPGARIEIHDRDGRRIDFREDGVTGSLDKFTNHMFVLPGHLRQVAIRLSKPGYETLQRDIPIESGKGHRHSFMLKPRQTRISITTDPEGAEVYDRHLNFLGTTPITGLYLANERLRRLHTFDGSTAQLVLTISKSGFQSSVIMHTIELHGANEPLHVTLVPES